jgi:microcystin-dependent protein
MGSTGAGTIGGATSSAHTHTISSCTLSLDQIPSHTHTVSLNQLGNSGAANSILNVIRGDSVNVNINSGSAGGGLAHDHGGGATGAASVTENRPLFVSCHYIIKVV